MNCKPNHLHWIIRFEGTAFKGKLNGLGKMIWPGGEVYHGEFRADREDGIGAFTTADGNTFCGEFHEGKGNGRSTLFNSILFPSNHCSFYVLLSFFVPAFAALSVGEFQHSKLLFTSILLYMQRCRHLQRQLLLLRPMDRLGNQGKDTRERHGEALHAVLTFRSVEPASEAQSCLAHL